MSDTPHLTDAAAEAIEQRANAASPGPWYPYLGNTTTDPRPNAPCEAVTANGNRVRVCSNCTATDSVFIGNARQDIPLLLADRRARIAELAAVTAERDAAVDVLGKKLQMLEAALARADAAESALAAREAEVGRLRGFIQDAMEYANDHWYEWGMRAEKTRDILETALTPPPTRRSRMRHELDRMRDLLDGTFDDGLARLEARLTTPPAEAVRGEREEQRRSFAFGNVNIHNPDVTRDDIDKAAERIAATREAGKPKAEAFDERGEWFAKARKAIDPMAPPNRIWGLAADMARAAYAAGLAAREQPSLQYEARSGQDGTVYAAFKFENCAKKWAADQRCGLIVADTQPPAPKEVR